MGASGAIRAGKAFVELFSDDTKLAKSLKQWKGRLKSWGTEISKIGAQVFAVGTSVGAPLLAASGLFNQMGSDAIDMAGRTGASVEALSTLGFAAGQTGAEIADLETSMKKGQKVIAAAAAGSKEAKKALAGLGLSAADLINKSPEDQFRAIATQIGKIPNPAKQSATAMQIFGKSGTKLLPMIKDLEALEARARELGIEMSTADAESADAFGDSLGELWATVKAGVFQVGAALAPTLTELVGTVTRVVGGVVKWAKENRALILTIGQIAAGVAIVGAVLTGIGGAIAAAGAVLGGIASIMAAIGTALTAVGAVLGALVSPIGLVVVGLVGLTAWFLTMTEAGRNAVDWLSEKFGDLKTDALNAFEGIRDALAAGDIPLAAQVLWTALRMVWLEGIAFLEGHWQAFLRAMADRAATIAKSVSDLFVDMAVSIVRSLLTVADALGQALGKDLIDKNLSQALKLALPGIGTGLKAMAPGLIDKLNQDFGDSSQAKADAAQQAADDARTAFDQAREDAARRRQQLGNAPLRGKGGRSIDLPDAGGLAADAKKGVGFNDVRTSEGFKSIAAALRQGRDDSARETARNTGRLLTNSDRSLKELQDINEALTDDDGEDFS